MKVLIVAGGKEPSKSIIEKYASSVDIIIGVDKGCSYLLKNEVIPNIIVGDFDSIDINDLKILESNNIEKYQYNSEKDNTDSDIAINLAIDKRADEIYMLAVTGSRLDHSFANLGLLKKAKKAGIKAYIIDDNNKMFLEESNFSVYREIEYKYISFLAYSDIVKNLNIRNAKYDLENYNLEIGDNRTVSNEFINEKINISFDSGKILVILSKD